ncbi:hypothetical protein [Curtobacterium sp. 9128]|uniref:hypothetical protein n=1 Tax=Curtobacterium sp. 9128 TaxID=1793722 RepID=UPI0011A86302|nr:hypothetical protein [Curtobacterium sp. 9128]
MPRVARTPGGVVGAVVNVVACAALVVGLPVVALTTGHDQTHVVFAIVGFAIAVVLETTFVRNLRRQLAARRNR